CFFSLSHFIHTQCGLCVTFSVDSSRDHRDLHSFPTRRSSDLIDSLLSDVRARLPLDPGAEITLEANPGTVEAARFRGFREAGVNRISLGVQSFDDAMLAALGRIHSAAEARRGVEAALASFDNVNL